MTPLLTLTIESCRRMWRGTAYTRTHQKRERQVYDKYPNFQDMSEPKVVVSFNIGEKLYREEDLSRDWL